MPSTGSRPPGSRSKVQLRSSWVGPHSPIEMTGSRPSSRRTMIDRFAHGQAPAPAHRAVRPGPGGAAAEPVAARLDRPAAGPVGGDPVLDVVGAPLVLAL